MKSLPIVILCALVMSCQKSPTGPPKQPVEPPAQGNPELIIKTPIPQFVRTDTLQIAGQAAGYDTIFCRNGSLTARNTIGDSGHFEIAVPIIKDARNLLLLYAKDRFDRASDTTRISFQHTSDNSIRIISEIPRFLNTDSLVVNGAALGFSVVFCEGGARPVSDSVRHHSFRLIVPLRLNATNALRFYARDSLGVLSDTIAVAIIHDNIPPRLLGSNVVEDSVSYPVHTPFVLDFDGPIIANWLRIGAESHATTDLTAQMMNESRTIHSRYEYLSVGQDWWLNFSVQDSAGNALNSVLPFRTYLRLLSLGWAHMLLSADNASLFAFSANPHVLHVVDTESWRLRKSIALSYEPTRAAENPLNGRIYVTSQRAGKITVVDVANGSETGFIIPQNSSNPQTESELWGIAFAKNGIGILKTHAWTIQIIDSRNSDEIYTPVGINEFLGSDPAPHSYRSNEKLILVQEGGSQVHAPFFTYDYVNNEFREILKDFDIGATGPVKGHHHEDLFAFGFRSVYLVNQDLQVAGPTVIEGPFDFTYSPGETQYVYSVNTVDEEISVIDLAAKRKLISADFHPYAWDLLTTRDGKHIVVGLDSPRKLLIVEPKTFR